MAFNSKTKQTAGPVDPDERLLAVMGVIVARVKELSSLRAELLAAEDAVRAAGGLGASVPPSYTGLLWSTLDSLQRSWQQHRRDLTGRGRCRPARLSWRSARNGRSSVRCDQKISEYTGMVNRTSGKDDRSMTMLQDWGQARTRHRRALAGLLAELRPQTKEVMTERMSLMETDGTAVLLRVA